MSSTGETWARSRSRRRWRLEAESGPPSTPQEPEPAEGELVVQGGRGELPTPQPPTPADWLRGRSDLGSRLDSELS